MGPTSSELHYNRPLTNFSEAITPDVGSYLADKMFAKISVLKKSDLYFTFPSGYWFKAGAQVRAPGTESVGVNLHLNTQTYNCQVIAAHWDLDQQTAANVDSPLNADMMGTTFVTTHMMNTRELYFFQKYWQPGVWGGGNPAFSTTGTGHDYDVIAKGTGSWTSPTSNPMVDILNCQSYMQSTTGKIPMKLGITRDLYNILRQNKTVLDLIRYTEKGVVTKDILANLLGVEEILVADAVLNTAQDGLAPSMGFMAANSFLLTYADPAPNIMSAQAGAVFSWTGYAGANAYGAAVSTIEMPWLKSKRIEAEMAFDMQIVAPQLGVYGFNAI